MIHRERLCSDAKILIQWFWLLWWRLSQCIVNFSRAIHRERLCSDAKILIQWFWLLWWRLSQCVADFSRAIYRERLCFNAKILIQWFWLLWWRLFQCTVNYSRATHWESYADNESSAYFVFNKGHISAQQISADQFIKRDHSSLQLQQIFDSHFVN